MVEPITIDLRQVARGLGLPLDQVQTVLELLDEGNTIPFITRYRKDQTGGLDEEQLRQIQARLTKLRLLAERKQTILRTIESQGKLTPELEKKIRAAGSAKRLEDLYLPYKPKKQTLATQARQCGLEPLAEEIISAAPACSDLDARASDFVDPDKKVRTLADALCGAGHIIAERFSERADLRQRLREILARSGRIVCSEIPAADDAGKAKPAAAEKTQSAPSSAPSAPLATDQNKRPAGEAGAAEKAAGDDSASVPIEANSPAADGQAAQPGLPGGATAENGPPANTAPQSAGSQEAEHQEQTGSATVAPQECSADESADSVQQPPADSGGDSSSTEPERPGGDSGKAGEAENPGDVAGSNPSESNGHSRNGASEATRTGDSVGDCTPADSHDPPRQDPPEEATAADPPASAAEDPPATASEVGAKPSAQEGEGTSPNGKQAGKPSGEDLHASSGSEEKTAPVQESTGSDPQAAEPGDEQAGSPDSGASAGPTPSNSAKGSPDAGAPRPTVAKASASAPNSAKPAGKKLSKKELRKKQIQERRRKAFRDYFQYSEEIRKIPPHRVLAINRGERAKILRVKLEYDLDAMCRATEELCVPENHPHADFLRGCARDALTRLIVPSLEREVRRELTERAETHAVEVFARNLRKLLLQPPVRGRRVLAVDPGFRSGCKVVALDQFGNVLEHGVLYLVGKPERRAQGKQLVCSLIERYGLTVIAIGNGTGCREAEEFFSALIAERADNGQVSYVIVNEAGASVYSTSRLGREEFPRYDASIRGAISIGRRLQDPLSELVKIDPANIGVGLYQHDVKAKHLRASLDEVVESCVNYVGVDVNTASPALLRYVSGLNQLTARRIYEYRLEHGPFRNRSQLRQVPGVGETTFVQAAGFLKITSGDNPLDATWIHPESYRVAEQVLAKLGFSPGDLRCKEKQEKLQEKLQEVDAAALASELGTGQLLLRDILAQLARPGRDPREDLPGPIFKRGVLKLDDLKPGMELSGTVLNVVDFGAFVDIGMHHSGLVHVSQLASKFVRDPHEVVSVGDIVRVWVLEVDKQRHRVSLTMIPPGTPPPAAGERSGSRSARSGRRGGQKPSGKVAAPAGDRPRRERRGRRLPERKRQPAAARRTRRRPPPPREPLPESVLEGKEPMRSFADLAQFFRARRQVGDQHSASSTSTGEAPPASKPHGKTPAAEQAESATEPATGDGATGTSRAEGPQQPAEPAQPAEQPPSAEDHREEASLNTAETQDRPVPPGSEPAAETPPESHTVQPTDSEGTTESPSPGENASEVVSEGTPPPEPPAGRVEPE